MKTDMKMSMLQGNIQKEKRKIFCCLDVSMQHAQMSMLHENILTTQNMGFLLLDVSMLHAHLDSSLFAWCMHSNTRICCSLVHDHQGPQGPPPGPSRAPMRMPIHLFIYAFIYL